MPKTTKKAAAGGAAKTPKKKRDIRAWIFGVPSSVDEKAIVTAGQSLYYILDNPPSKFALLLQPKASVGAIRWFTFRGNGGASRYSHEPWFECLSLDLGELFVALKLSLSQNAYFAHIPKGSCSPDLAIRSDGPALSVKEGKLSIPYPQNDFPADRMSDFRASRASPTPEERALFRTWKDAIGLGLEQTCPDEPASPPFEEVIYSGDAWLYADLRGKTKPARVSLDEVSTLRNLLHLNTWML